MNTVTLKTDEITPSPYRRVSLKNYDAVVFFDGYERHLVNNPRAVFFSADKSRVTIQAFDPAHTVSSTQPDATVEAVIGERGSKADWYGVQIDS